jgi:acetyltransferase
MSIVGRGLVPRRSDGRHVLPTEDAFTLLAKYGITVAPARLARSGDEASRIAENFGTAVALKAESPAVLHKTEAGAVRLGVRGADDVRAAFATIVDNVRRHDPSAPVDGVLVQAMVTGGTEMVVGLHQDPQFGPLVMVGLGGIFVEVLEDVAFGAVPLTRGDAEEMLASLRGARILDGVRGRPRADREALIDVLLAVSRLAVDAGGAIAELDLNPLVVLPEGRGAVAVDALVVLSSSQENP